MKYPLATLLILSLCGCQAQNTTPGERSTPAPKTLSWYTTCGDPVCRPDAEAGPNTCGDKQEGQSCSEADQTCDPGSNCGQKLICAEADPKQQPGGCPISLASAKQEIQYLSPAEQADLAKDLQQLKLASYRYRLAPDSPRLGFMIDDQPQNSPLVLPNGQQVDIYGYLSMAVATIQVQQKQIDSLEARIKKLESQIQP